MLKGILIGRTIGDKVIKQVPFSGSLYDLLVTSYKLHRRLKEKLYTKAEEGGYYLVISETYFVNTEIYTKYLVSYILSLDADIVSKIVIDELSYKYSYPDLILIYTEVELEYPIERGYIGFTVGRTEKGGLRDIRIHFIKRFDIDITEAIIKQIGYLEDSVTYKKIRWFNELKNFDVEDYLKILGVK